MVDFLPWDGLKRFKALKLPLHLVPQLPALNFISNCLQMSLPRPHTAPNPIASCPQSQHVYINPTLLGDGDHPDRDSLAVCGFCSLLWATAQSSVQIQGASSLFPSDALI